MKKHAVHRREAGASLIEVLVTILILSFGMLALSGMLAYAVQMPKLSAYRATAMSLAAGHVERMRANPAGFSGAVYNEANTYGAAIAPVVTCVYPACDTAGIAALDKYQTNTAVRAQLPEGGVRVRCSGGNASCGQMEGDIWVIWQEPITFAAVDASASDECPDWTLEPATAAPAVQPRCVHIKFRL